MITPKCAICKHVPLPGAEYVCIEVQFCKECDSVCIFPQQPKPVEKHPDGPCFNMFCKECKPAPKRKGELCLACGGSGRVIKYAHSIICDSPANCIASCPVEVHMSCEQCNGAGRIDAPKPPEPTNKSDRAHAHELLDELIDIKTKLFSGTLDDRGENLVSHEAERIDLRLRSEMYRLATGEEIN